MLETTPYLTYYSPLFTPYPFDVKKQKKHTHLLSPPLSLTVPSHSHFFSLISHVHSPSLSRSRSRLALPHDLLSPTSPPSCPRRRPGSPRRTSRRSKVTENSGKRVRSRGSVIRGLR
ncbi:hypothetical protein Sjap_014843 [Stephania japonica]|uniref:Uncharacterized protein n=1 Tax=Stephania japonica TaxID=461633 RepID=A0AAP0II13_9MAGN